MTVQESQLVHVFDMLVKRLDAQEVGMNRLLDQDKKKIPFGRVDKVLLGTADFECKDSIFRARSVRESLGVLVEADACLVNFNHLNWPYRECSDEEIDKKCYDECPFACNLSADVAELFTTEFNKLRDIYDLQFYRFGNSDSSVLKMVSAEPIYLPDLLTSLLPLLKLIPRSKVSLMTCDRNEGRLLCELMDMQGGTSGEVFDIARLDEHIGLPFRQYFCVILGLTDYFPGLGDYVDYKEYINDPFDGLAADLNEIKDHVQMYM